MLWISEYLMVLHEAEMARLASQAQVRQHKGVYSDREPAVRDGQAHPPAKLKEVTACP